MKKNLLAIFAGIVTGFVVVAIGDAINHQAFPPPEGIDFNDKAALEKLMLTMPTWVLGCMLLSWLVAAFAGGFVAGKINKEGWKKSCLITGIVLLAGAVANMILIPHPVWMMAGAGIGYIPCAYAGGRLAS